MRADVPCIGPAHASSFTSYRLNILRSSAGKACAFLQRQPLAWALPLQAILLFANLELLDPWTDEEFALSTTALPAGEIVATVSRNIHPPLYYLLLHWWNALPWKIGLLESSRAMSSTWAMLATLVVYVCWLKDREPLSFQMRFLALWVLSPCLLLHARMARSYSMQMALAAFVVWAALRWADRPTDRRRWAMYVLANAALLYTHYLPGAGLAAGLFLMLLARRRYRLAAVQSASLTVLYLPWLPTLLGALAVWASGDAAPETASLLVDQLVRLAYLFVAFAFGETFPTIGIVLAILLAPVMIYTLWKSAFPPRPAWLPMVLIACGAAWVGVSRIEQFVFMPSGLFFALPFFLLLIARRLKGGAFAALLALYACADYAYFDRNGYLVKPYAAPNREMAEVIRAGSAGREAILAIEPFGSYSPPLVARLEGSVRVVELENEEVAADLLSAVRADKERRTMVWVWRHTSDISPNAFVTRFEHELSLGRDVRLHEFVPYSLPERWARRLLRGPGQADFYYRLYEVR